MRIKQKQAGLVILFFLGVGLGTVLALLFQQTFGAKMQIYQPLFRKQLASLTADKWDFFLYILQARFWELAACMIISLTIIAYPAFCLLCGYGGFCIAGMVVTATIANGGMGLPIFFASVMPHYLLYGGGILLLMIQSCLRHSMPNRYVVQSYLFIGGIFLIGIVLETWVNPFLLEIML